MPGDVSRCHAKGCRDRLDCRRRRCSPPPLQECATNCTQRGVKPMWAVAFGDPVLAYQPIIRPASGIEQRVQKTARDGNLARRLGCRTARRRILEARQPRSRGCHADMLAPMTGQHRAHAPVPDATNTPAADRLERALKLKDLLGLAASNRILGALFLRGFGLGSLFRLQIVTKRLTLSLGGNGVQTRCQLAEELGERGIERLGLLA